jgi:hypothetical protein
MSTGSAYPEAGREQERDPQLDDLGGPSLQEDDPSSGKDIAAAAAAAREIQRPIPQYPLMREV